jgi:hypothetical protein
MTMLSDVGPPALSRGRDSRVEALYERANDLWPRLDRGRLIRTNGDPRKIARLIARRTVLTEESILLLLLLH